MKIYVRRLNEIIQKVTSVRPRRRVSLCIVKENKDPI